MQFQHVVNRIGPTPAVAQLVFEQQLVGQLRHAPERAPEPRRFRQLRYAQETTGHQLLEDYAHVVDVLLGRRPGDDYARHLSDQTLDGRKTRARVFSGIAAKWRRTTFTAFGI